MAAPAVVASGRPGRGGSPCDGHLSITPGPLVSGTFQQVTNLLDIMDGGSAKMDTAGGTGPDMRKTLASVIITEKATVEPSVVMNALIRCLQVPEVGPARPQPPLGQHTDHRRPGAGRRGADPGRAVRL